MRYTNRLLLLQYYYYYYTNSLALTIRFRIVVGDRPYDRIGVCEYLVGHGDVVELRSVTDDLFSLINPVVGAQPHHRLRQVPARSNSQLGRCANRYGALDSR